MGRGRTVTWRDLSLEFVVGCFFFAALMILAWFTIVLSREQLFHKRTRLTVLFPAAAGLGEGDPVLVRGVRAGRVERIRLGARFVQVRLALDQPLKLFKNCEISIRYASVLGGRHVYIYEGNPAAGPVPQDTVLYGEPPPDLMTETARLVQEMKRQLDRVVGKLDEADAIGKMIKLIDDVRAVAADVRAGKGTAGRLFRDETLYNEAVATVCDLRAAGDRFQKMAESVTGVADGLRNGKGTLGRLLADDSVFRDLQTITRKAAHGDGTVARLLNSSELYHHLDDAAADFRKAAARLNDGRSTISRFLTDDGRAYSDLEQSLADVRTILDQVRRGKGTLGRLVNDPTLYDEARTLVLEVQRAVEDFREQTPVSTFGSLLFGAL